MGDRTVPERVSQFLVRCSGRPYCDHCIQERLGLRWRQQVQLVTATLGVTSDYRRSLAICCTCNVTKQVTTFVGAMSASSSAPKLSLPRTGEAIMRFPATRHSLAGEAATGREE